MNGLEAVKGRVRKVVKEGVTVVKTGGNKRVGESDCSVGVKERADLSEDTELKEGRFTDGGDMGGERVVVIEGDTEVEGGIGRNNSVVLERHGGADDFGTLLGCAYEEEFSFGRVEGELI